MCTWKNIPRLGKPILRLAPNLGIPSFGCPILRLGRFQVWAQHKYQTLHPACGTLSLLLEDLHSQDLSLRIKHLNCYPIVTSHVCSKGNVFVMSGGQGHTKVKL